MNKKIMMMTAMALAATMVIAAPTRGKKPAAADDDAPTTGKEAKIMLDQFPKLGRQSTLPAPALQGGSIIGACYTKPRKWIVLEAKYTTFVKWQDQLTFTWHVLLETKSATENKGNRIGLSPYSYFNTTVTYFNIPQGSHAACVCLPPSYLELYGEPKAIGFTISNQNGDILGGGTVSEVKGIKPDTQFWEDQTVMNATTADGKPMIERRQGLVDRSKTPFWLVNNADYEQVQ